MTTQQANTKSTLAENGDGSGAPQKRELTSEEHLQKANRLMENSWDMIYEDTQKARQTQNSDA